MIITLQQFTVFILIVSRFTGMVVSAPFFNMKSIFSTAKIALIFWVSLLVLFVIPLPLQLPTALLTLFVAVVLDFFIGVAIGFVANLIIMTVSFAGTLMDTQAGLSSAATLDPISGSNSALLEQFMQYIAIMMFLILNGHHLLLSAVFESFSVIPIGTPVDMSEGSLFIVGLGANLFKTGFQLATPIILVVFIIDFSFGILNKIAEQINVFQLGFQVKPIVSIFIFLGVAPGFVYILTKIIEESLGNIIKVLGIIAQ
jgi:flagellar biosynthetic protein FliR